MMKNKNLFLILSILSFIFMITLNSLANILPINGYNTGQLSDMYPNLFVPAGITFSIWGIIYIALILFIIGLYKYSKTDEPGFQKLSILYMLSNILNGSWILAWHYKIVWLSLIIMLALLITLIFAYIHMKKLQGSRLIKYPISLYLGWISLATVANASAFLVLVEWNRLGLSEVFWTITMIIVVLLLTITMLIKEKDIIFSLIVLWAYTGIIIKRLATVPVYKDIVLTTELSALIVIILIGLTVFRSRKKI